MPKVSVLMPAYQAEQTIAQAIASVQAQTLTDWELVVVDDGCTDHTVSLVNQLMASDSRIRLVSEGRQGVLGRVRNTGLRHAQGEFVNFLDSDDLLQPDALESLHQYLQANPTCRMVYGQFGMIDASGKPYPSQAKGIVWLGNQFAVQQASQPSWASLLTSKTHNAVQSVLVRRADAMACGGFPDEKDINCSDYVFFVRMAKHAGIVAIHALPQVVFQYRQMPNSLSYGNASALMRKIDTVIPTMNNLYQPPLPPAMLPLKSMATAAQFAQWMRSAARKQSGEAMVYAMRQVWQCADISLPHKCRVSLKGLGFWVKSMMQSQAH